MSDLVLFDSNILVYAHNLDSQNHSRAKELVETVTKGSLKGVISQQNILEFYSITTDRRRVAKPLSPLKAKREAGKYLNSNFTIIFPKVDTLKLTLSFLKKLNLKNGEIFDAYLVATMLTNQVKTIYTDNVKDFTKYPQIKTVNPLSQRGTKNFNS